MRDELISTSWASVRWSTLGGLWACLVDLKEVDTSAMVVDNLRMTAIPGMAVQGISSHGVAGVEMLFWVTCLLKRDVVRMDEGKYL